MVEFRRAKQNEDKEEFMERLLNLAHKTSQKDIKHSPLVKEQVVNKFIDGVFKTGMKLF